MGGFPHPRKPPFGSFWEFWEDRGFDSFANSGGSMFRWRKTDRAEIRTNHFPDMGGVRASYTGQSAPRVGILCGGQAMSERVCEPVPTPRPWHTERREYVAVDNKGRKRKKTAWFLFDANGNPIWRSEVNMRFVCDCVNREDRP